MRCIVVVNYTSENITHSLHYYSSCYRCKLTMFIMLCAVRAGKAGYCFYQHLCVCVSDEKKLETLIIELIINWYLYVLWSTLELSRFQRCLMLTFDLKCNFCTFVVFVQRCS